MSTQFRELYGEYPGPVYNPIGGDLLGQPHSRKRHLEMWADALFEGLVAPSARGGWERGADVCYDEGLRVCKECGAAVMVNGEYDEKPLNRHRAWHDELYQTIYRVAAAAAAALNGRGA